MKSQNIGQYIEGFPPETQTIFEKVRETIGLCAIEAKEDIVNKLPIFKLNGTLVHFGGFKKHIGFYPAPPGISHFQKELADYETAKGSVLFPMNKPIPYTLIAQVTKFRVKEQMDKS